MIGVHYVGDHVAITFKNHLAHPIFCDEWKEYMTLGEGMNMLEMCIIVLFYQDGFNIIKL
jgi:hypothetical protein